jgi:hypothetical protein
MVRITGWRALPLALIAMAVLAVLALFLLWLAVAAAAVVGLVVFQLVYLPRIARRLRLAPWLLALVLLPLCVFVGWLALGEATGPLAGAGAWALLVAAPRVAVDLGGRWLGRRAAGWASQLRTTEPSGPSGLVIATEACPRCGRFRVVGPGDACPHCAAERPGIAPPA